MSIASVSASAMVCSTSGWSGMARGPARFSAHAIWSGNTAATRSSACMRWMFGGTFAPPRNLGMASETLAFHRQRTSNIGASSSAWVRTSRTVSGER